MGRRLSGTYPVRDDRAASLLPRTVTGELVSARSTEDVQQSVVPFMTGVLEHRLIRPTHRYRDGERPCEDGWVVNCVVVKERVLVDPLKALGQGDGEPGPDGLHRGRLEARGLVSR